jgi:hypothetical protein
MVVIGIMAALFALTAVYFVGFRPAEFAQRGLDQVSGTLLIARQQARRDGLPTGVWMVVNSTTVNNVTYNFVSQMYYIQQPDDFAVGVYLGFDPGDLPTPAGIGLAELPRIPINYRTTTMQQYVAVLQAPIGINLTNNGQIGNGGAAFPVQQGDFLEIYGGGVLRRIVGIRRRPGAQPPGLRQYQLALDPEFQGTTPKAIPLAASLPPPNNLGAGRPAVVPSGLIANNSGGVPLTNYRIIPQPRLISGEGAINLPEGVGIDFTQVTNFGTNNAKGYTGRLSSPPMKTVTFPAGVIPGTTTPTTVTVAEILFSPSGSVIGEQTGATMNYLWVRRVKDGADQVIVNQTNPLAGRATLVTVQTRTGFIATTPVTPVPTNLPGAATYDPYALAKDNRASGM